jgi:hypothetical protein
MARYPAREVMTEQTPPPVSQADYIESLWQAVKAGQIDWAELRALQAAHMPKCTAHNASANVKIAGVPMCAKCIEERRHARP